MATWDELFGSWSKGPDEQERLRIENTEQQIRLAISSSALLQRRNIKVFTQGSYRNRVNVKKESDIDIGVLCYDVFFDEYPDKNLKESIQKAMNFSTSEYTYLQFKNEIEQALIARFGKEYVKRGNKAIDIKETRYRVDADVCAFFEHRRYAANKSYLSGVEMRPDDLSPPRIINWPEQHFTNSENKHSITGHKFRKMVRVLKKLTFQMADEGLENAKKTPSFLIECLLWNVPNNLYDLSTYSAILREAISFVYNKLEENKECNEWGEVSELKYLLRSVQPWTIEGIKKYLIEVWNYVGYK